MVWQPVGVGRPRERGVCARTTGGTGTAVTTSTSTEPRPPSGRQVELTRGEQRAVVVQVGGGLRAYTAEGRRVLDGYAADERASSGRGQVLLPWPNRLDEGRWEWEDRTQRVPVGAPEEDTARHGLARWLVWEVEADGDDAAVARLSLPPQPGWPGWVDTEIRYALDDDGLQVTTRVTVPGTAGGPEAVPVGLGFHPFLHAGDGVVDDCEVTSPGRRWQPVDDRGLPYGDPQPVVGGDYELSRRRLGDVRLDAAVTDLDRDRDGWATTTLRRPDGSGVRLKVDETYRWLQLFTGDTVSPADRRRKGLAVEPMTCPADALRSGTDLVVLEPGQLLRAVWRVEPFGP